MALDLCMITLPDDPELVLEDIQRAFTELWPQSPAPTAGEGDGNAISFQIGEASIVLAKMPAPIPWEDLEGPCETSIFWPDAADELRLHQTHLIVTASADVQAVPLASLLTQAAAAVLKSMPQAQGVYWGRACLLIPRDLFVEMATELLPDEIPYYLWVDVRVGMQDETSCSGFTTGLSALGHKEIECENAAEPPGELRERLYALAGYVLEKGAVIRDGDTVGEDHQERIRVVFAKSSFGHEGTVMRLVYEKPSPAKPWWKLW